MSKLKSIPELIPPKSKQGVIKFHAAELREYVLFQEQAHKDPFMRNCVLTSFCTCCGRWFSKHQELRPVIHHKNYNCRCLNGVVKCCKCYEKNPSAFKLCKSKLCCICNECHDKIYEIQVDLWGEE